MKTVLESLTDTLSTRKRGMTAPELQRRTGRHMKSVRNRLGEMIVAENASFEEYTRRCKITGKYVTAYTKS